MEDQNCTPPHRRSHGFSQMIAEGLEKREYNSIEHGLGAAYDLFVEYVLEDRHSYLMSLGRDLNAAYFPHRSEDSEPSGRILSYLGQVRALVNLCDHFTQRLLPEGLWEVVSRSKYTRPIMQAIQRNGAIPATELCAAADLPFPSQLQRTVQPLIDHGLIRREKFGRNVWYSLTSTGRLVTTKYFGMEDTNVLDSVLPAVLSRLTDGWQSFDALVDSIRCDLPVAKLKPLIASILSSLQRSCIAHQHSGSWRIAPGLLTETRELIDISRYPELMRANSLIEEGYGQLRTHGAFAGSCVDKARTILDSLSADEVTSEAEDHAFGFKVALEKAKCSALSGDWKTAFALIRDTESASQTCGVDAASLRWELGEVWKCIEVGCLDPLLGQISGMTHRDYDAHTDVLLMIHRVLTCSQPWNPGAGIAIRLSCLSLDMAREFEELEREYQQITIEDSISEWQKEAYNREQTGACARRWQPLADTADTTLLVASR